MSKNKMIDLWSPTTHVDSMQNVILLGLFYKRRHIYLQHTKGKVKVIKDHLALGLAQESPFQLDHHSSEYDIRHL
jgi:hypothetical protein